LLFGLTLATKPEEIYLALIEAVAYGTKTIIDIFENGGIEISECLAGGGIAVKNKLLMQIFADITGKTVKVTDCAQAGAVGSAILAASAAEIGCAACCLEGKRIGRHSGG
jgi:L-ribulokinase